MRMLDLTTSQYIKNMDNGFNDIDVHLDQNIDKSLLQLYFDYDSINLSKQDSIEVSIEP